MTRAYRQSLEDRLAADASRLGRDLNWVRRRHAFVRALHRIVSAQPEVWALKGGFAVELRRPGLARATKDLDLALRSAEVVDGEDPTAIRDLLLGALAVDADADGFRFELGTARRMAEDAYGRPAWRFAVTALLAARRFSDLRIDVVCRPEELVGLTSLELDAGTAAPRGAPPRRVVTTDLQQQFAEKVHALTRRYETGESSRVKDLVDLVLLVHDGVRCDASLVAVVHTVFAVRQTHTMPTDLGDPPVSWRVPFAALAGELDLAPADLDAAHALVAKSWRRALDDHQNRNLDS